MRFRQASLVTGELLSSALATHSQRSETPHPAPPCSLLSFPVFTALTLPKVNIAAASREWVVVRFQLDGEFSASVYVVFLTPFCRGPSLSS